MKDLKNLGKILIKKEQQKVFGGGHNYLKKVDDGCVSTGCCSDSMDCRYIVPFSSGTIGYGSCGDDGYCHY